MAVGDQVTERQEGRFDLGVFHFSWCQTSEVSSQAFRGQNQLEITSKTVGGEYF
jgi:hypothetical protein